MSTARWLIFVWGLTPLAPLAAQEVFPNVEYVSGHEGYRDKVKGQLELSDSSLRSPPRRAWKSSLFPWVRSRS